MANTFAGNAIKLDFSITGRRCDNDDSFDSRLGLITASFALIFSPGSGNQTHYPVINHNCGCLYKIYIIQKTHFGF